MLITQNKIYRLVATFAPTATALLLPLWFLSPEPASLIKAEILTGSVEASESLETLLKTPDFLWARSSAGENNLSSRLQNTHWSRIQLPTINTLPGVNELIAETKFPFHQDLEFFLVENGKVIDHILTGKNHPGAKIDIVSPYLYYKAQLGVSARTLYIRSLSQIPDFPNLLIRTPADFETLCKSRLVIMSILAGFSVFLLIYHTALLFALRNYNATLRLLIQCLLTATTYYASSYDQILFKDAFYLPQQILIKLIFISYVLSAIFIIQLGADETGLAHKSLKIFRLYRIIRIFLFATAALVLITPNMMVPLLVRIAIIFLTLPFLMAQFRYIHQSSLPWLAAAHSGLLIGIIVTDASILHLIADTKYGPLWHHVAVLWLGTIYAAASALKLRNMTSRQAKITRAMNDDHAKTELNHLLTPAYEEREARVFADVSIMFVDIVQFSLVSERRSTDKIYVELARKMRVMIEIVERAGGSVDRSLGDGILCFFGYSESKSQEGHASAALRAAVEIQQLSAQSSNTPDNGRDRLVLPMRIGIHSARVVIGNLGDSKHLDFTMIGSGVNFASRLETACSPFKVLLSQATLDQLQRDGFTEDQFTPVSVAIKHKRGLTTAFEFDPLKDRKNELIQAETAFLKQLDLNRTDIRLTLTERAAVHLESELGRFEVIDFSPHGFKTVAPSMIGRQALVMVKIITTNESVNQELHRHLLQTFMVEVRWSKLDNNKLIHGLKIYGNSEERKSFLFNTLKSGLAYKSVAEDPDQLTNTAA